MPPCVLGVLLCLLGSSVLIQGEEELLPKGNGSFPQKQNFGLAWLFGFNKKNRRPHLFQEEEEEETIDKRALDTNIYMTASHGKMRVLAKKSYVSGDLQRESLLCNFEETLEQVETREGEDVQLNCKLQNLHYQIDLTKLKMDWNWIEKSGCNESTASLSVGDKIVQVRPQCIIMTDFPFTDLQTSSKNISCTANIVLSQVTVNNTGKYRCSASFGFLDSNISYNHLFGEVFLRVSRRNDYHIHKIVATFIAVTVLVVSFSILVKKLLKFKLSWEGKHENYAAVWPGTVPARRIASSGSLGGRRLSGSIIVEEEEEDEIKDERDDVEEVEVIVSENAPVKSSLKRSKLDTIGETEYNFEIQILD